MISYAEPGELITRARRQQSCSHPLERYYTWFGVDPASADPRGVLCIACSACGAVLRGGLEVATEERGQNEQN